MKMMIGQYGGFDYTKYERDFKTGFYGIEACLFASEADTEALIRESQKRGFRIGVHFPFRAGRAPLRDALFLSEDRAARAHAYALIEAELDDLSLGVKPEYVLFHYPKPVILDASLDLRFWNFADEAEYVRADDYSMEALIDGTRTLFEWLSEKSRQYAFVPVLEFDALSRMIYRTNFLEELLNEFPAIRLCLDTARLHLQASIDREFDAAAVLRKYARYAHLIHLSSLQVKETTMNRHQPVLPELRPQDGWAPIEDYLAIIAAHNPHVRILLEHRSDRITDKQLDQCYEWVTSLMTRPQPAN